MSVLVTLASACGGQGESGSMGGSGAGGSNGQGGSGGSLLPAGGGPGSTGGSGGGQTTDTTCGATGLTIEAIPPDMLVVFDRSCSMRRFYDSDQPVFGAGPDDPKTRWYMAVSALDKIMTSYGNKVHFGLMVFPRPLMGCGDSPVVDVAPAGSNDAAVLDKLSQVHPFQVCAGGGQPLETPTAEALSAVKGSAVFEPAEKPAYVLLMTDGMATCGATDSSLKDLVQSLAADGVKTAVVGFGDFDAPEAKAMLDAMGEAGGVKTSAPWYWFAEDPAVLDSAIGEIVKSAVSCTFKLNDSPPDPDKLYAYFDGQPVPGGPADGWTHDAAAQTVEFHGASCAQLKDGAVKNVSIVFGCPDPICTPSAEVCDGYDNDCDGDVDEDCVK